MKSHCCIVALSISTLSLGLLSCSEESANDPATGGAGATIGTGAINSAGNGASSTPGGAAAAAPGVGGAQGATSSSVGGGGMSTETSTIPIGATGMEPSGSGGADTGGPSTGGMGGDTSGNGGGTAGSNGVVSTDNDSGSGGTASTTDTESGTGGAGGSDDTTEPETMEPEFHIYLAVGQSNMQGAAFLPDEPIFHERVLVLQDQNCPQSDGNPHRYGDWREMFPPLIKCKEGERTHPNGMNRPIGLGPADSFAVAMAEAAGDNVTIGIVGAAYGDTSIEQHLPNCTGQCLPSWGSNIDGAPVVNGTTRLYDWVVDLGRKAQERGVIKGIIFHQGENNASNPSNWLSNVNAYVTALRSELGLDPADCPFVAGELPHTGGSAASLNPHIQQIPDHVENGHWVSAGPMEDGTVLGDRGDGIHWGTESVIEMGKRYAAKMREAQAASSN